MSYNVERSKTEIDELLTKCEEAVNEGTGCTFLTYEEGIQSAILWLIGEVDENPLDDE